jgi:hypothetical protein
LAKLDFGDDSAAQVRAFLAIGDEIILAAADEQAVVMFIGINERDGRANGNLAELRDSPDGGFATTAEEDVFEADPALADDEGEAGKDHELGEIAAGDVVVALDVDGEVFRPLGQRLAAWI